MYLASFCASFVASVLVFREEKRQETTRRNTRQDEIRQDQTRQEQTRAETRPKKKPQLLKLQYQNFQHDYKGRSKGKTKTRQRREHYNKQRWGRKTKGEMLPSLPLITPGPKLTADGLLHPPPLTPQDETLFRIVFLSLFWPNFGLRRPPFSTLLAAQIEPRSSQDASWDHCFSKTSISTK